MACLYTAYGAYSCSGTAEGFAAGETYDLSGSDPTSESVTVSFRQNTIAAVVKKQEPYAKIRIPANTRFAVKTASGYEAYLQNTKPYDVTPNELVGKLRTNRINTVANNLDQNSDVTIYRCTNQKGYTCGPPTLLKL